jgi:hypothetical protein
LTRLHLLARTTRRGIYGLLIVDDDRIFVLKTIKETMKSKRKIDLSYLTLLIHLMRADELVISE